MTSFNVQPEHKPSSGYLLEWINLERHALGKGNKLTSFDQVLDEGSIYEILTEVDLITFEGFGSFIKGRKMDIIEKYLDKQFGKRVKWVFKQSFGDLSQTNHIMQFTKLVCFFSIHSKKKNDVINRILTLPQQTQNFLMEQMQQMDKKLENITEIRQIIQEIQYLQQQNEEFQQKIKEMAKVNSQVLQLLKQSEAENKLLKAEIQKYRKQKYQVFAALNIDYISDYLEAYNRLRLENDRYLDLLRQTESRLQNSQRHVNQLNDRAKNDFIVISNLTDQITRLKQICNQRNEQSDWFDGTANSKLNILKSAASNKQNFSKCSTSLGRSAQVPAQWLAFVQNEDSQNSQKFLIRSHNGELLVKLQTMYKKYNQLNKQATQLRQSNKKLIKANNNLKQTITEIEMAYNEFQFKYKAVQNQDKFIYNKLSVVKLI